MLTISIKMLCRSLITFTLVLSSGLYAQTNLATNKTITASSAIAPASAAIDGNSSTRWESAHGVENVWIQIDLGVDTNLTSTVIDWEAANPANYQVLGSSDAIQWASLSTQTNGQFGNRTDTIPLQGQYRYLRINTTQRSAGNAWGYSIWEWRIYGANTSSSASSSSSTSSAQTQMVQAEDFSNYQDSTLGNTGGAYHPNENVDIEPTADSGGGFNLGWITQGEWLDYPVNLTAGTYDLRVRVASNTNTGKYTLLLDNSPIGTSAVGNTGGWQNWITQTLTRVTINSSGTHQVRFRADGGDFNFNWFEFVAVDNSSSSSISSSTNSLSSTSSVSSSSSSKASLSSNSISSASSFSSVSSSSNSLPAVNLLVQAEDYADYLDLSTGNTGGAYRPNDNVDIEATSDTGGGFNVGWISQGEWLEYNVTLAAGTYKLNTRVASNTNSGKYTLLLDNLVVGSASVSSTGGWQTWVTQTAGIITLQTPGTHKLRLMADGSDFNLNWIQFEVNPVTSSSSSSATSSTSSSSSSDRNHYDAPRATTAPVIDGVMDPVWNQASWAAIDVFWLGTQRPAAQDFSGRYKAMWDAGNLYLLFDITDDALMDASADPLVRYWDDDSVEIFIDENKSGGNHQYNTSAWAYHVSTLGDVVDFTNSTTPKLLNSHITVRRISQGSKHLWEMSMRVYGDNYDDNKINTPITLFAGKQLGFSVCYNDNDSSAQRESMVGSVDTQGHKDNLGYIDASVFGSMSLVDTAAP